MTPPWMSGVCQVTKFHLEHDGISRVKIVLTTDLKSSEQARTERTERTRCFNCKFETAIVTVKMDLERIKTRKSTFHPEE